MKKAISVLLLALSFSLASFAQGKEQPTQKQMDSAKVAQEAADKYIIELPGKATVKELQEFLYNNLPAKEYNENFIKALQYFYQTKYAEFLQNYGKKK
jgi:hypothetical protein